MPPNARTSICIWGYFWGNTAARHTYRTSGSLQVQRCGRDRDSAWDGYFPSLDQAVPESWHWPEERAAGVLGRDGWSAGEHLMQVADARQWQNIAAAVRLSSINAEQIKACAGGAAKTGNSVSCTIKVAPSSPSGT
jgi:hypothetical protein